MTTIEFFLNQLNHEAIATRKMLALVPNNQYDFKPHPKSMGMRHLVTHIAELPAWIPMAINTEELDFAAMDYTPTNINNTAELLELFEKSLREACASLIPENEARLNPVWTLRNGADIYSREAKWQVIRMALSQIIHHRAQLGVYLRLLDVPIPGSYGPSADEEFVPLEVEAA
jgi:uncharacterized damage-inducible protein DinB